MRRTLLFLAALLSMSCLQAQDSTLVFTLKIRKEIDPRMNRYVELGLARAEEMKADYLIVDMDTYGGTVLDAKDIVESIMDEKIPVWVFINKDAASAGALIAISCDSIYMSPGASIGAATVVTADGAAAPDKYQSYMRGIMRSVATENGRDPAIAEAMVDQSLEVPGISKAGQVVTFTTNEAIEHGFCEGKVNSIPEILERNGVTDYTLYTYELGLSERIISIFLNPVISGVLILIIIGGIWFELQTPGIGFPLAAAVLAAILYFTPYYLNGLAENWEIIAFFIGLILIMLEIFVIPGFGVAGISGIVITITALILVMLNNDLFDFSFVGFRALVAATLAALSGVLGSIVLLFIAGVRFTESRAFARVALTDTMNRDEGYTSTFYSADMIGKTGTAQTVLRPSGRVIIDGEVFDAYTRGEYIDTGEAIIVVSHEGTSLKVRKFVAT